MIFHTVRIEPDKDTWKVRFDKSDTVDRDEKDLRQPLPLGFYHYPETMPDLEAKTLLIHVMIARHEEEIEKLVKSKAALIDLL